MKPTLRCLIAEDSDNDALFLVKALEDGGYAPVYEQVCTPETLCNALQNRAWDVVFCDYFMPGFNAPEAYLIFAASGLKIPFITVSGEIGEAHAIGTALCEKSRTKGTISISTRRHNGWVEVRVGDTGTGIPENIRHRIFEPFFTTKPVGQGTGQGLALAHSVIVERHKGQLLFETETGQGTCFIIRLPLNPPLPQNTPAKNEKI